MQARFLLVLLVFGSALLLRQSKYATTNGLAAQGPVPNVEAILGDQLFMSRTEVSNLDYREYLTWLQTNNPADVTAALPDTMAWTRALGSGKVEALVNTYFRHPAYDGYPLVNVSYEQANAYCAWLSDRLNALLARRPDAAVKRVVVRLPDPDEWEMAAYAGLPTGLFNENRPWYPWGHNQLRYQEKGKYQGKLLANYNHAPRFYAGVSDRRVRFFSNVHEGFPTGPGFYHLSGNVAEMTSEPGVSKGGSFRSPGAEIRIQATGGYVGPAPDLGFRYLVEVVEHNDPLQIAELDARAIEKQMLYIPDTETYASRFEVSNREYARFLRDHPDHAPTAVAEAYAVLNGYASRERYGDHPAVNISHAAALAYCAWLTELYNAQPKRAYQRVTFYLPDAAEFTLAARGGRANAPYPWGGPYVMNAKGCYLTNYSPREEQYLRSRPATDESGNQEYYYDYPNDDYSISRGVDGYTHIAEVDSYYPNDYGLYLTAGNAAEMLAEPGVCMGGGWLSPRYFLQVETQDSYDGPRVDLGFRVWMRVEQG